MALKKKKKGGQTDTQGREREIETSVERGWVGGYERWRETSMYEGFRKEREREFRTGET